MNDFDFEPRYKNGADTLSISEIDQSDEDIEEFVCTDYEFQMLLRWLDLDEKFICLSVKQGYKKKEIAFMMSVHPSKVSRTYQMMLKKIEIRRLSQENH